MENTTKCKFCWAVIPAESEECPKCGSALVEPPQPEEFDPSKNWHVVVKDEQQGPLSTDLLKEMISSGIVGPKNLVRQEGDADWSSASRYFEFDRKTPTLPAPVPSATEKTTNQCPKCGSWNIQRLSMYLAEMKAQKKSGSGCGIGCLILILFLIAPGYCLCTAVGAGAGAGALIAKFWPLIVIGILLAIAVSIGQYFFFICKSCGHKFIKKS